ncbi:MAG: DnaJ domain-containing protein, partial [Oligoflexia bacterium]|nr:DnaJ domain-containing protein [Oligoflexia bacterium]
MSESQRSVADHYDTLGVLRDASTDEIKKAFRKLARQCHPDVAGDAPEAQARFTHVREAYETLVDPVRRATYDRRGYSTFFSGPGRKGGKWRPPGGFDFEQVGDPKPGGRSGSTIRRGRRNPANDIGLEDIFGDFGGGDAAQHTGPKASPANRGTWGRPVGGGASATGASSGRDIQMKVDVPASIADNGGTVTLNYP